MASAFPFQQEATLGSLSGEEEHDAERIWNTYSLHPTFPPTPSAPLALFNAHPHPVGLPPVDVTTSSVDSFGEYGQPSACMDRTLSIGDPLIASFAWTPRRMYTLSGGVHRKLNFWTCRIYYFLEEVAAQSPSRSHHRLIILRSTGNPTPGRNVTKQ
ncbi:hypothetical protein PAXINDRAFT_22264 [Paxillus involutus ATCC 200175]|uniref:Uncharacterized protein n=1 Tax=Paxillus involutus ATCC 200175 TaxID=664439 RepID=A0A0C9TAY5_PAXIN|nr:hypothetical protein PAXINDRAFT_22264 [Paxillus involutus ATCC 200175]